MTKVLLINSNRFKHPWPVIPFGLCCIAAHLEQNGHTVFFLDLNFSKDCAADIHKGVQSFGPDIIGVTIRNIDDGGGNRTYFLLEDVGKEVIEPCKKEFSGPIVIGGPSVGVSGSQMLHYFDLEYAVQGDGEATIREFVRRFESKESYDGLDGLIIRREGKIVQERDPFRVADLNCLPFPNPLRYLDIRTYLRYGSPLQVQTKRGCALKCSYCTYNRIEGNRYRLRDPNRVADEVQTLVKETGIRHIEFTDSNFNIPLSYAKEVLEALIQKKLDLKLHTMGLNPGAVDEELVDLMKRAGFNEVDLGAEAVCDATLKSLAKDFTKKDVINAANLLKKKKVPATWFIMLGAPAETRETVLETLDTVSRVASKWDLVLVSTGVRIYNGSPIARQLEAANPACTNDHFLRPVKIEPAGIRLEEIYAIVKHFSFRFPNFYLYDREDKTPLWFVAVLNYICKLFRTRQPVWRGVILVKIIQHYLGLDIVRRLLFDINQRYNKGNHKKADPQIRMCG